MITDKNLFDELIYIGPRALVALKTALCDLYGDHGYEDEDGIRYTNEAILADFLINLAKTGLLRIAVVAQADLEPNERFVPGGEGVFSSQAEVDPAKHEELVKKLSRCACIYATAIKGNKTTEPSH